MKSLCREVKALQLGEIQREQMGATASLLADASGGRLGRSGPSKDLSQEEMERLAQEVTPRLSLSQYVTYRALEDRNYVDQTSLSSATSLVPTVLPVPQLADRIKALEAGVIDPDSRLNQLIVRVDDMSDSKITDAVMVANVVFRDIPVVEAFLSRHEDSEIFHFCADMKVQLMDLQAKYTTVKDGLK